MLAYLAFDLCDELFKLLVQLDVFVLQQLFVENVLLNWHFRVIYQRQHVRHVVGSHAVRCYALKGNVGYVGVDIVGCQCVCVNKVVALKPLRGFLEVIF